MRRFAVNICMLLAVTCYLGCSVKAQPYNTQMVPMRDGIKLATDIYLPSGNGPFPVVLMRTPYGRGGAEGFLAQGFAVAIQNTRGRYGSEGFAKIFFDDGWGANQDGADTIAWIKSQKWCNSKIGMYGGSANGMTQYLAAGSQPEGLTAITAIIAPANIYNQCIYQNGALREEQAVNWVNMCQFNADNMSLWHEHSSYDSFWKTYNLNERFGKVHTAGLHIGGWYDTFQQGTIDAFVGLQKHGGAGAKGHQRLIIGPFSHGVWDKVGEFTYPNVGQVNVDMACLEWLNEQLKGMPPAAKRYAVTYYTMGAVGEPAAPGNQWRYANAWPIPAKETSWYPSPDGSLTQSKPTANNKPMSYQFDPKNPVPTRGGCNLTIPAGSFDQRSVENRPDVLLFNSAPLNAPVEVTGHIRAKLWITSSTKDTDFTAKLTDVYPDGRSMLVCDGILRARYRKSLSKPEWLTPGKPTLVEVDMWSTSIVFNKGHRIRLALSSSNSPRFDVNPNTGGFSWDGGKPVIATNSVLTDSAHPSVLLLPIVK